MMHRRQLVTVGPVALMAPLQAHARLATPAQAAGPFYPDRLPPDDDADLVQVEGQPRRAWGTVLHLAGRVLDLEGRPSAGTLVEIWQCDANGRYHHPLDRREGPPDPGFQGYGRTRTRNDGHYAFRTIRPAPYPGRTPHIHFAITAPGRRPLVTQMYVRGEEGNGTDGLYRRLTAEQRERVTIDLTPRSRAPGELDGEFNIVLAA